MTAQFKQCESCGTQIPIDATKCRMCGPDRTIKSEQKGPLPFISILVLFLVGFLLHKLMGGAG